MKTTIKNQDLIFQKWIKEHKGIIFKILYAYSNSKQDQDDLFQDICLQLWKSILNFKNESKETTWIYRVALNTSMQWSRKETQRNNPLKYLEKKHFLLVANIEEINEEMVWLYDQIRTLDDIDRSITLLYLDNLSYDDISDILGISKSNIGVKLNRIKAKLIKRSEVME